MSASEDEFGDVDEGDLLLAAEVAESSTTYLSGRSPKRRRLDSYDEDNNDDGFQWQTLTQRQRTTLLPEANLRQTTLTGMNPNSSRSSQPQSQLPARRNWPLANRPEAPTHHRLDNDALETWVYPTNLGTIRDYQFSIVSGGLYHNLLVALPTGLGKTFIAATIMLNWFRWTKDAQIVFVAPTKPLVSQQVEACFGIAGIPRASTTMLTGEVPPGLRAEEWSSKRVFFMTPQTIINDLKTGICDPKRIVLLVVDEAHRATGNYAYVEVVKFLRRFNTSFRVLALTATPGSTVESVQQVIDGLGISRVEIRTEESIDIRQYVHSRHIDPVTFNYNDEMTMVMELFSKALQPLVNKLTGMNAYWTRDPMALTPFGCTTARQKWMSSDAGRRAHMGVKGMVNGIFSILASLAHGIELLKYHGIGPFYQKILEFRTETESEGSKGSKYRRQVIENPDFQTMMNRVQTWYSHKEFIGHPKLEYLQDVILNHLMDAGEGAANEKRSGTGTRIMVFAHYRDSAEEIVRVLRRHEPIVKPTVFVGQAHSKGSEGMGQKKQLEVIEKFKSGVFNTLVATSIGEEGLDIGEVDLIVCYDASASPIRMLQRMGRTGRKRAGNIVVMLMEGKEQKNFEQAKDNYQKMQSMIAEGSRFTFHDDLSPRIVPKGIQPVVDKRVVEIPIENTQPGLPEPKKRGKPPKRPPKKFHMPDDVVTGFTTASGLAGISKKAKAPARPRSPSPVERVEPSAVCLTEEQERSLLSLYQNIPGEEEVVEAPRLDKYPALQRSLRPTCYVGHGRATKSMVDMLNRMHNTDENVLQRLKANLHPDDKALIDSHWAGSATPQKENIIIDQLPSVGDDSASSTGPPSPSFRQRDSYATNVDPTSPLGESDDSDIGSLADFINDDADHIGGQRTASSVSTPPEYNRRSPPLDKPTHDSVQEISSDEDDDELLDLNTIVNNQTHKTSPPSHSSPDTTSAPQCRKRKRKVILDEDSEED